MSRDGTQLTRRFPNGTDIELRLQPLKEANAPLRLRLYVSDSPYRVPKYAPICHSFLSAFARASTEVFSDRMASSSIRRT